MNTIFILSDKMKNMSINRYLIFILCLCSVILPLQAKKSDPSNKPDWAAKDINDMSEADMERLLDQWDEDEEPLPPDELPEHLRPAPKIDMTKFDSKDPEGMLKMMKKDKTLMMFVNVDDSLTRDQTEETTKLWQTSLWNNHLQAERFLIDNNRAIFMFKDGSMAWEAKDFLVKQDKCKEVVIENNTYQGPAARESVQAFGPQAKPSKTAAKEEL